MSSFVNVIFRLPEDPAEARAFLDSIGEAFENDKPLQGALISSASLISQDGGEIVSPPISAPTQLAPGLQVAGTILRQIAQAYRRDHERLVAAGADPQSNKHLLDAETVIRLALKQMNQETERLLHKASGEQAAAESSSTCPSLIR
ncbi:TPA: hypothetical protein NHL04_005886 [Pseudomonas aeruginosa]|nr:hypothetical protein [Pseudomonas aeruginosa]